MDRRVMDYLMDKMDSRRRDRRDRRDYERDRRDYEDSRDYEDNRDNRDYEDYSDNRAYDERDYGHKSMLKLNKSEMRKWKNMLENADGTSGAHYDMQQIMQVADKLGIKFKEFDEKDFCLAVNMMYSDYCRSVKKYVSPEKELHLYADMARDFLEDPDAPEGAEKLALYYHCIVNSD